MNKLVKYSTLSTLALSADASTAGTITAFFEDGSTSTEVTGFVNVEEDVSGAVSVYNVSIRLDDGDGDNNTNPSLFGLGISAVASQGGLINFQGEFRANSFVPADSLTQATMFATGLEPLLRPAITSSGQPSIATKCSPAMCDCVCVSVLPKLAISDLVRLMKGRSSHKAQRDFPQLKKRYWGRRDFSTTNEAITQDIVHQFLEQHIANPTGASRSVV